MSNSFHTADKGTHRRVMLVGDQLLSEGQTLNSYTVTRLEPDRIELEPASSDNTVH